MSRLKQLRKSHGITQDELGEILGVQKAAVCKYETGRVPLPHEAIVKLCDHFRVTADYLLGIDGPETVPAQVTPLFKQRAAASPQFLPIGETVGVQLVGRVHAGLPILAEENISEYIGVPASDVVAGEYFYMEVEGDCMIGEFIPEGALVLVRLQPRVENGQIAVVRVEDEVLLRKVKYMGSTLMLIPANTKYEPMIVPGELAEVVGRVVEVRIRGL